MGRLNNTKKTPKSCILRLREVEFDFPSTIHQVDSPLLPGIFRYKFRDAFIPDNEIGLSNGLLTQNPGY